MGGGTHRATITRHSRAPRSPTPPILRHPCAPTVIPAPSPRHSCAGRNPHAPSRFPQENSSLPPSRGEVRWGVGRTERAPLAACTPIARTTHPPSYLRPPPSLLRTPAFPTPPPPPPHPTSVIPAPRSVIPAPRSVIPAQAGTPRTADSPKPCYPDLIEERKCATMPTHPHPLHTPNNPEQIRTKLNKPKHRRTPRPDRNTPKITPEHPEKNKPEQRRHPLASPHPLHTPNNPEQIRTNLNTAERPDQIGTPQKSPPNTPKK